MVGLEHGPAVLLYERAHGVQALESAKWVFDCHGGAGRVRVACIERGEHVGEHAHVCDGEGRVGLAAHEVRDGLLTAGRDAECVAWRGSVAVGHLRGCDAEGAS